MKIGYYSINDSNKEIIHSEEFNSLLDAVYFFAAMKRLEPDEFLKLYRVKRIIDEYSR